MPENRRIPLSEDHRLLGQLLRAAREQAGATTHQVADYSSGHISNVENGYATPSRELLEHYISRYGCARGLALRLYNRVQEWGSTRRRKSRSLDTEEPAPPRLAPDSPLADIRACYQVHQAETYYQVDRVGVIRTVQAIRWIAALYPQVDLAVVRFWYPSDYRDGLSLEPGTGCNLAAQRSTSAGYLAAVLRTTRTLNPTDPQPHSFAYSLHNASDIRARPTIRFYANSLVSRYAIRIQFHESSRPERIWMFRDTDSAISAFEPDPKQLLGASSSGFFHADFININRENVGISWDWPE